MLHPVEVKRFLHETPRAKQALDAVEAAAHDMVRPWLVMWGYGGCDRRPAAERRLLTGGHVLFLDVGYWQRDVTFRMSIDAPHPQRFVMQRECPSSRAVNIQRKSVWDEHGPVLVAGIGEKAKAYYGPMAVDAWTLQQVGEAAKRGRTVVFRPKRVVGAPPIERALEGISLVVTWSSNVAIDAIRCGIPAICHDGAAAAVCPSIWPDDMPKPLDDVTRDLFLHNLGWFQWAPSEAKQMWSFVREMTE